MGELIYNQRQIPKEQWRYGLRPSSAVGCGWIAIYNALTLLGWKVNVENLIRKCQWQTPVLNGTFGTTLWGPAQCLKDLGFPVAMKVGSRALDRQAREADVCILFYRWQKGARLGAHFVAVQHTPKGFVGYNTFTGSQGPDAYGESLEAFLARHHYFGAVLTQIWQKEKCTGGTLEQTE